MAELTVQNINDQGLDPTYTAASGGGDTFDNDGNTRLLIENASDGAIDVTIPAQNTSPSIPGYGTTTKSNSVLSVGAGKTAIIGPFPVIAWNDASGEVSVSYSGTTSLSVAAVRG